MASDRLAFRCPKCRAGYMISRSKIRPELKCPKCAVALSPLAPPSPAASAATPASRLMRAPEPPTVVERAVGPNEQPPASRNRPVEQASAGRAAPPAPAATAPGKPAPAQVGDPSPDEMIGRKIAQFEVTGVVGEGRMGPVYQTVDTLKRRPAALKVLAARLVVPGSKVLAGFLKATQAAARLNHPNVLAVYQVGQDRGIKSYFVATELVKGGSAADFIRKYGPMAAEDAARVLREAAKALAYAHGQKVPHLGVKPGNLLLGEKWAVKVADFQMGAALLGLEGAGATAAYLSPEQNAGKPGDHRSDIYSLGATFYCLITGEPPFAGKNAPAVLNEQEGDPPDPRKAVPDLPDSYAFIVKKSMARDPARRFASVEQMAAELGAVDAAVTRPPARPPTAAAAAAAPAPAPATAPAAPAKFTEEDLWAETASPGDILAGQIEEDQKLAPVRRFAPTPPPAPAAPAAAAPVAPEPPAFQPPSTDDDVVAPVDDAAPQAEPTGLAPFMGDDSGGFPPSERSELPTVLMSGEQAQALRAEARMGEGRPQADHKPAGAAPAAKAKAVNGSNGADHAANMPMYAAVGGLSTLLLIAILGVTAFDDGRTPLPTPKQAGPSVSAAGGGPSGEFGVRIKSDRYGITTKRPPDVEKPIEVVVDTPDERAAELGRRFGDLLSKLGSARSGGPSALRPAAVELRGFVAELEALAKKQPLTTRERDFLQQARAEADRPDYAYVMARVELNLPEDAAKTSFKPLEDAKVPRSPDGYYLLFDGKKTRGLKIDLQNAWKLDPDEGWLWLREGDESTDRRDGPPRRRRDRDNAGAKDAGNGGGAGGRNVDEKAQRPPPATPKVHRFLIADGALIKNFELVWTQEWSAGRLPRSGVFYRVLGQTSGVINRALVTPNGRGYLLFNNDDWSKVDFDRALGKDEWEAFGGRFGGGGQGGGGAGGQGGNWGEVECRLLVADGQHRLFINDRPVDRKPARGGFGPASVMAERAGPIQAGRLFFAASGSPPYRFRIVAKHALTTDSFAALKAGGLPAEVLTRLAPLRDKPYAWTDLGEEITSLLEADENEKHRKTILSAARTVQGLRLAVFDPPGDPTAGDR